MGRTTHPTLSPVLKWGFCTRSSHSSLIHTHHLRRCTNMSVILLATDERPSVQQNVGCLWTERYTVHRAVQLFASSSPQGVLNVNKVQSDFSRSSDFFFCVRRLFWSAVNISM